MINQSSWIGRDMGEVCPEFFRKFNINKQIENVRISITAIGIYEAFINGKRIGDFIFSPGCTSYLKRLQYQTYDITNLIKEENEISVVLSKGWHRGRISAGYPEINSTPGAIIAEIIIQYANGETEKIFTDKTWSVRSSNILFADFYDGEVYDATIKVSECLDVEILNLTKENLIPQEGELVCEHERIKPVEIIITPKGEKVIDFGQNMAGYVEIRANALRGTEIEISHAEVLDDDGNFYTKNYRSAKAKVKYICSDEQQIYKPHMTFYGFRYIRLDKYPIEINTDDFTAIAVYSDIKRTGYIECSDNRLNQFFSNVVWGQKSNFIDVPMDCPQRDERQPWTGDAQMFVKTAAYNYDVSRFFEKWIGDLCADQFENGAIPDKSPNFYSLGRLNIGSAAWGDAITIVPWSIYQIYGNKDILKKSFDAMKKWVDYITNDTIDEYLWTCPQEEKKLWGHHYGDWLALDTPDGGFKGATDDDIIASAFYAYSTKLLIKSGKALGKDMSEYEQMYKNICSTYKKRFNNPQTQTACVLALYFGLTDDKQKTASVLAKNIIQNGKKLKTGFVGTPYLLYALSENGYLELAYDLLLSEECPSWLYEVKQGATTVWEHWDAITAEDGKISVSSNGMDSFNHYAFGSVMEWVYTVAAGIKTNEEYPGFEKTVIEPLPDKRLSWLSASLETKYGIIRSKWEYKQNYIRYEISVPSCSTIIINNKKYEVEKGEYIFNIKE